MKEELPYTTSCDVLSPPHIFSHGPHTLCCLATPPSLHCPALYTPRSPQSPHQRVSGISDSCGFRRSRKYPVNLLPGRPSGHRALPPRPKSSMREPRQPLQWRSWPSLPPFFSSFLLCYSNTTLHKYRFLPVTSAWPLVPLLCSPFSRARRLPQSSGQ